MSTSEARLDGNALAGLLLEIFGVEMTVVPAVCGFCGARNEVAKLHVYVRAPGTVVRCAACENVLMRVVQSEERTWIDVRALTLELRR